MIAVKRLEDFGIRNATTPEERMAVYQEQCRGLPKLKKARFWLGVLEADSEVAKLCRANGTAYRKKRGRPPEPENVPNRNEVGQIEEFGVSQ